MSASPIALPAADLVKAQFLEGLPGADRAIILAGRLAAASIGQFRGCQPGGTG